MEYVLTKKERAIVEAEVTIDGEIWAKAQKKSFNKLANNLQIQGFRKGKVPADMAKRYIDPRKVLADSIDLVLQDGYAYVLDNEKEIEVMDVEGKTVVLDLKELEYISSAGLRVVLKLKKIMDRVGSLEVINANELVLEVFEITGFAAILGL